MGWLCSALSILASAVPTLPQRAPAWLLLGPCGLMGVGAVLIGGARTPLHALVLFAAGGAGALVAINPAWAVVPLLIVDLTLATVRVPVGTSLRLLVTLVAFASAVAVVARSRSLPVLDTPARFVVVPTVLFVVVSTLVNMLFSEIGFVVTYLRYQVVIVITLLLVVALVRDRRALTIVSSVTLVVATVSALFAIGQRIGGPMAWYATSSNETITIFDSRVFGLSATPVALANSLLSTAVPAMGFLATTWQDQPRARLAMLLATLVILVGIYLTTTRSALIAAAASFLVILVAVGGRRQMMLFGIGVTAVALFAVALTIGLADQRFLEGTEEDKSAASHAAIGQVALAVALDNVLLGIGRENFEQVSQAYQSEVSLGGGGQGQLSGRGAVGSIRPHNDFLEVWSSWGIFGLLAYLGVFAGSLRNFIVARRSVDPFVRGLAVGGMAGLIAYAVNSTFHNYLDSSVILWFYAGLSASLASILAGRTARVGALRRRPARRAVTRRRLALVAGGLE